MDDTAVLQDLAEATETCEVGNKSVTVTAVLQEFAEATETCKVGRVSVLNGSTSRVCRGDGDVQSRKYE